MTDPTIVSGTQEDDTVVRLDESKVDPLVASLEAPEDEAVVPVGDVKPVIPIGVKTKEDNDEEVRQLRAMLRDQRTTQAILKEQLETQNKRLEQLNKRTTEKKSEDGGVFDDPASKVKEEPVPEAELEKLQREIYQISATKGEGFVLLAETMAMNPKYEDLYDVCSKQNFGDFIEAAAQAYVTEHGGSVVKAQLEIEKAVWSKPNPYKYMYETIKASNPKYAVKTPEAGKEKQPEGKEKEKPKGREPQPHKAPGSVAGMGGSTDVKGGWTSAIIDDMDEMELGKIPKDIYDKYMRNELD